MSTIRVGNIGPLTGNTSVIADPGVSGGGMSLVNMTAISLSGTYVDFTGIPSWARRITVVFSGASTTGGQNYIIQLGTSGGITSSGYSTLQTSLYNSAYPSIGSYSNGFNITNPSASSVSYHGIATIMLVSGNTWVSSSLLGEGGGTRFMLNTGSVTLSGSLSTVRVTQTTTDTFDAGTVNVYYE